MASLSISAQKPLDTIFVNEKMNVALFFPEPIRQGITGSEKFVFTYNREKEQYFGLLQAKPGEESNLLAITNNGEVYSYIIKYSKNLFKLNYFINENESIGNEKPKVVESMHFKDTLAHKNDKSINNKIFSEHLLKSKLNSTATKRKNGLVLRLLRVAYHKDEVYLVMEIKNSSGIDFEIDYISISRVHRNKNRKSSFQSLGLEVISNFEAPRVIENKKSKRFVYVLPKFVLGDNENLQIELKEFNGNRKLILKS